MNDPAREQIIERFLAANGFALREARPLAQDASFRRYLRLNGAVLMDAPSPEDVRPFLRIAAHLAGLGLSVPRIVAADADNGLVLEEDLGDALFSTIIGEANAEPLFDAAIDALVVMHRAAPPDGVPVWGKAAMMETALGTLFDWWWPRDARRASPFRRANPGFRRSRHDPGRRRDRAALPRASRLFRRKPALAAGPHRAAPRRHHRFPVGGTWASGL